MSAPAIAVAPGTAAASRRALHAKLRARVVAAVLLATLLLVLATATLAASALAISVPQQLDEGEPLIYGLSARILDHQPLYQSITRQPFVQVHYTPVYYLAVAVLRRYIGPGFTPGRLLSVACGVVACAAIAFMAAGLGRNRWLGVFAVLMFLGLAFPGGPAPFLALERVDMLGVGLSLVAIAVLLHGTTRAHLLLAGPLASVAILTKQSLFAAILAGTIWLVTTHGRVTASFVLSAAVTLLAPVAILQATTHGAFWDNIGPANPSPSALEFGAYLFRELVVIQGIPTLLAALYVLRSRAWTQPRPRLLMLYWLASMPSVVGIVKVGANHNYWIELAAANAILASLAISSSLRTPSGAIARLTSMLPAGLLALALGLLVPARFIADRTTELVPATWTLDLDRFAHLSSEASGFANLVRDVSGEKGLILAESLDVAVLGNHPMAFEPFAFSMLEQQGRWRSDPLVDDICSGRVKLLVLTYPIESDIHPVGLRQFPMWPNSVMTALRRTMQFEQVRDWHFLYRSPQTIDSSAVGACKAAAAAARSGA